MRVGVIGAGQLGRMLALAGYPLALGFRFLDSSADSPGGQIAPIVTGAFDDAGRLDKSHALPPVPVVAGWGARSGSGGPGRPGSPPWSVMSWRTTMAPRS